VRKRSYLQLLRGVCKTENFPPGCRTRCNNDRIHGTYIIILYIYNARGEGVSISAHVRSGKEYTRIIYTRLVWGPGAYKFTHSRSSVQNVSWECQNAIAWYCRYLGMKVWVAVVLCAMI